MRERLVQTSVEAELLGAFRQHRTVQNITIPTLAARAKISKDRVQRLLGQGEQRLRVDEMMAIAAALNLTRSDMVKLMWPDTPVLENPVGDAATFDAPYRSMVQPASDLAAAAAMTGLLSGSPRWSFRVFPFFEGPTDDVRVRMSTGIAVRPVEMQISAASHEERREAFLADFPLLPSGVQFAVAGTRVEPSNDGEQPGELLLRCAAFAADRRPSTVPVDLRGLGDRGVVVTALRANTRSLRLTATLARALGWGLISTSRMGRDVSRQSVSDPRANAAREIRYANLVLGELLATCPAHTFVNHVGTAVVDATGRTFEEHSLLEAHGRKAPFVIYLAESDALLERSLAEPVNARGDLSRFSMTQLTTWRDQLRALVLGLQDEGRGLVMDVDPTWASRRDTHGPGEEQLRWRQTCEQARTVLHELFHLSGLRRASLVCRDDEARSLLASGSPVAWH